MYKKTLVVGICILILFNFNVSEFTSAYELNDEQQLNYSHKLTGQATQNIDAFWYFQEFIPDETTQLSKIEIYARCEIINISIWDGKIYHGGNILRENPSWDVINNSWNTWDFSDLDITIGNSYYIAFHLFCIPPVGYFAVGSAGENVYPGELWWSSAWGMFQGTLANDVAFKIWGINNGPNTPDVPSGTTNGMANTEYTYSTMAIDPEGDQVYYKFDWDDGTYSDWEGPYNSGETGSATHNWECGGTYHIKVKAKDGYGGESSWSSSLTVTISNNQPNPPNKPTGTTTGYHGVSYTYSTSATDPENQQVKIYFDWDDGSGTWTDYVNSGQSVSKSHTWTSPGTYNIKAKAKDKCGLEGGWSEDLLVNLQNQAPNTPNTPNPLNGATGIGTDTILSWEGGDPNGDTVYYDIYFGTTNPPPKIINDQTSTTYDPPGELENLTKFYWKIIAEDQFGDQAPGPIWNFTTRQYHAPVLSLYDGWPTGHQPDEGGQNTDFTFCIHYYDTDQDPPIAKKVLFDNGKEFTMELFNGQACNGDYKVVLKGSQIGGGTHIYWFWYADIHDGVRYPPLGEEDAVTINHAPNAPILSGPTNGVPNTEYIFSAVTDDPEGDDIKYKFFWDDGTDTGWIPETEWKQSGNSIDAKHSWLKGTYTIRAKSMDRDGDESPWSNEITLKVQKGRYLNYDYLQNFIEKFIQKFPLLNFIISSFFLI